MDRAQVLFVVTKVDRNFYDQRVVEFELFNRLVTAIMLSL